MRYKKVNLLLRKITVSDVKGSEHWRLENRVIFDIVGFFISFHYGFDILHNDATVLELPIIGRVCKFLCEYQVTRHRL